MIWAGAVGGCCRVPIGTSTISAPPMNSTRPKSSFLRVPDEVDRTGLTAEKALDDFVTGRRESGPGRERWTRGSVLRHREDSSHFGAAGLTDAGLKLKSGTTAPQRTATDDPMEPQ